MSSKSSNKKFYKAVRKGLVDPEMSEIDFDNWLELDENIDALESKKEKNDDDKRLAGVKSAKKEGFTHTNKAKV
tara:strand:- start:50 stop:271 length:222 start_codon:yes stop_codon:yes gene_type:complete